MTFTYFLPFLQYVDAGAPRPPLVTPNQQLVSQEPIDIVHIDQLLGQRAEWRRVDNGSGGANIRHCCSIIQMKKLRQRGSVTFLSRTASK